MIDVRPGQATFTHHEALRRLREAALQYPNTWRVAEGERSSIELAWLAGSTELGTPEALRLTRRFVAPVAQDLEWIAAALPPDVEIGPIRPEYSERRFTLGLRPRTARPKAERCRCGASPRYGTRLYGDEQLCAICALWGETAPRPV